jgi:hypothetical protein
MAAAVSSAHAASLPTLIWVRAWPASAPLASTATGMLA